jgi:hypothetical protein
MNDLLDPPTFDDLVAPPDPGDRRPRAVRVTAPGHLPALVGPFNTELAATLQVDVWAAHTPTPGMAFEVLPWDDAMFDVADGYPAPNLDPVTRRRDHWRCYRSTAAFTAAAVLAALAYVACARLGAPTPWRRWAESLALGFAAGTLFDLTLTAARCVRRDRADRKRAQT